MTNVYVKLLNEGVEVYRPVSSLKIASKVYVLGGEGLYDPEDEEWEFLPGSRVKVTEKKMDNEMVLVAVSLE